MCREINETPWISQDIGYKVVIRKKKGTRYYSEYTWLEVKSRKHNVQQKKIPFVVYDEKVRGRCTAYKTLPEITLDTLINARSRRNNIKNDRLSYCIAVIKVKLSDEMATGETTSGHDIILGRNIKILEETRTYGL